MSAKAKAPGKKKTDKKVTKKTSESKETKKTTAKTTVAKTSTSKKASGKGEVKQKAQVKKATAKKKASGAPAQVVTPEQRWKMIADAAYLKAEKRGFAGGNELDDWTQAEKEIDAMLPKK